MKIERLSANISVLRNKLWYLRPYVSNNVFVLRNKFWCLRPYKRLIRAILEIEEGIGTGKPRLVTSVRCFGFFTVNYLIFTEELLTED